MLDDNVSKGIQSSLGIGRKGWWGDIYKGAKRRERTAATARASITFSSVYSNFGQLIDSSKTCTVASSSFGVCSARLACFC